MSNRLLPVRDGLERVRQLRHERQYAHAHLPPHEGDALRRRAGQELATMLSETQSRVDQLRRGLERAGATHARAARANDASWLGEGRPPRPRWAAAELDDLNEFEAWLHDEAERGIGTCMP